jgi:hypothetical protein
MSFRYNVLIMIIIYIFIYIYVCYTFIMIIIFIFNFCTTFQCPSSSFRYPSFPVDWIGCLEVGCYVS